MPVIEKDKTSQVPGEQRFSRAPDEIEAPSRSRPTSTLMLLTGLLVAAILIVSIVLATAGGDTTSGGAANAPAKPASAAPAKRTVAPSAPTPAANIAVTLKEFTISPTPAIGRAGTVTFRVHNGGTMPHEFVVLRTNKPADALLKGNEASEAGNVGEIPGLAPGATKTLRLTLKAGHYALICNMPGHYMAGQRVDFAVK
jgi:uncharacterized cupredoxin-like copper-binding protein